MKKVRKAVFPVAGMGSRFLPATKAMPKELLPIVDKPLIQYAAEEAVHAGIDTLIFITGRNKRAIEDHFDCNNELQAALIKAKKFEHEKMVRNILPPGVECIFVRQPEPLGLGHAVSCAERVVGDEPFAVLLADDFCTDNDTGATANLLANYAETGKSQLTIKRVPDADVSKYGIVKISADGSSVEAIIEKPDLKNSPSNLASIGRYVLTSDIFEILKNLKAGAGGEIQLADALNICAQRGTLEYVNLQGKHYDCGSIEGFMDCVNYEFAKRK